VDWGRAKSVLILAFLLLNAVLGYQLWMEWQERIDSAVDWTSLPPETRQLMTSKGIRIDSEIPTEMPLMRELTYKLKDPPDGASATPIPLDPQPNTRIVFSEEELQQALGGTIPELAKYRFDNPDSNEQMFVLNRMEGDWPIFDVRIELYYKNQKITGYRQDRIEGFINSDAKPQKVLPATQAVDKLIKNYLQAGAAIKEIELGYHGQMFDSETQVSIPSWRVLLEDGEVYYVNANSGEVVTDQPDKGGENPAAGGAVGNGGG
jgi:regulatory protein YycI of two-component signal transduction system YycFG